MRPRVIGSGAQFRAAGLAGRVPRVLHPRIAAGVLAERRVDRDRVDRVRVGQERLVRRQVDFRAARGGGSHRAGHFNDCRVTGCVLAVVPHHRRRGVHHDIAVVLDHQPALRGRRQGRAVGCDRQPHLEALGRRLAQHHELCEPRRGRLDHEILTRRDVRVGSRRPVQHRNGQPPGPAPLDQLTVHGHLREHLIVATRQHQITRSRSRADLSAVVHQRGVDPRPGPCRRIFHLHRLRCHLSRPCAIRVGEHRPELVPLRQVLDRHPQRDRRLHRRPGVRTLQCLRGRGVRCRCNRRLRKVQRSHQQRSENDADDSQERTGNSATISHDST